MFLFAASSLAALTVTVHGGAGRVGGSCASVQSSEAHVIVDCGALGSDDDDARGAAGATEGFPFDVSAIDAVCLTHAHQDHAGRVPELVAAGFRGPIYMTEATRELLRISWKSQITYDKKTTRDWRWSERKKNQQIYIHWRTNCTWSQRISAHNLHQFKGTYPAVLKELTTPKHPTRRVFPCGACREAEVEDLMTRVTCVEFGATNQIKDLSVVFSPTKHLPGASAIRLADKEASCLFSGDLGTRRSHCVKEVPPGEKADAVFVESTYGASCDVLLRETEAEYRRFRQLIGETVQKDGIAWVPAFALDRSQRVLLEIKRGMDAGEIPSDVPIYMLSPSARENTALYASHPEWFDVRDVAQLGAGQMRLRPSLGKKDPTKLTRAILLTTSGMMDTASSYSLLPSLAPRTDVTVCLVGYQAPGTPGFKLVKGAKELSIFVKGKKTTVPVACTVKRFSCFSGHGDAREIDLWLANNLKSKIYLVHGGDDALAARREDLATRLGCDVSVVKPGEKLTILPRARQESHTSKKEKRCKRLKN